MDEIPSAEFRKQYAKLTKPTTVTVNGHPIGVWFPGSPVTHFDPMVEAGELPWKHAQAQRDDLLRKINRGPRPPSRPPPPTAGREST